MKQFILLFCLFSIGDFAVTQAGPGILFRIDNILVYDKPYKP